MIRFICFLLLLLPHVGFAQGGLGAFHDYRNYFFVFDKGNFRELEYLPVQSYRIGAAGVAYVDQNNNLKMYYDGRVRVLMERTQPKAYHATDNLFVFDFNGRLGVFEQGQTKTLTYLAGQYSFSDSIVVFDDGSDFALKAYYDREIYNLESRPRERVQTIKTGENIAAYIMRTGHLKVFFRGETTELETIPPAALEAGRNIVAYIDGFTRQLKVYYDGEVTVLEEVQPQSMKVSDDRVTYVDNEGRFKTFFKGQLSEISSFTPDYYQPEDDVIIWRMGTVFNVHYLNASTVVENFIPERFWLDWNNVVYIDAARRLAIFDGNAKEQVTVEQFDEAELFRNVVYYKSPGGLKNNFYWNGKLFSY